MREYIFFMHDDVQSEEKNSDWDAYIQTLNQSGAFVGGSAVGAGTSFRQKGMTAPTRHSINGFIRVRAIDMDAAKALLSGNPTFELGGTVDVHELLET